MCINIHSLHSFVYKRLEPYAKRTKMLNNIRNKFSNQYTIIAKDPYRAHYSLTFRKSTKATVKGNKRTWLHIMFIRIICACFFFFFSRKDKKTWLSKVSFHWKRWQKANTTVNCPNRTFLLYSLGIRNKLREWIPKDRCISVTLYGINTWPLNLSYIKSYIWICLLERVKRPPQITLKYDFQGFETGKPNSQIKETRKRKRRIISRF